MTIRGLTLSIAAAVLAAWWLLPVRFASAVRESHLLDMLVSLAMAAGIVVVARWIGGRGRRRTGTHSVTTAESLPRFPANRTLWIGFAVSIFVLLGGVPWKGPAYGSYFDRLTGAALSDSPPADLAGQAVGYAFAAAAFAWPVHAAVIVALALLTGGPSFVHPKPRRGTPSGS